MYTDKMTEPFEPCIRACSWHADAPRSVYRIRNQLQRDDENNGSSIEARLTHLVFLMVCSILQRLFVLSYWTISFFLSLSTDDKLFNYVFFSFLYFITSCSFALLCSSRYWGQMISTSSNWAVVYNRSLYIDYGWKRIKEKNFYYCGWYIYICWSFTINLWQASSLPSDVYQLYAYIRTFIYIIYRYKDIWICCFFKRW
jgi:hypothetical protein